MVGLPAARGQLGKSPATKVSKARCRPIRRPLSLLRQSRPKIRLQRPLLRRARCGSFESPQACQVQDPQALESPQACQVQDPQAFESPQACQVQASRVRCRPRIRRPLSLLSRSRPRINRHFSLVRTARCRIGNPSRWNHWWCFYRWHYWDRWRRWWKLWLRWSCTTIPTPASNSTPTRAVAKSIRLLHQPTLNSSVDPIWRIIWPILSVPIVPGATNGCGPCSNIQGLAQNIHVALHLFRQLTFHRLQIFHKHQ